VHHDEQKRQLCALENVCVSYSVSLIVDLNLLPLAKALTFSKDYTVLKEMIRNRHGGGFFNFLGNLKWNHQSLFRIFLGNLFFVNLIIIY
jgi:hypothetical protein